MKSSVLSLMWKGSVNRMGWLVAGLVAAAVAIAAKTIGDKLGKKSYSSSSLDDQIDVDRELSTFRENINDDARKVENKCM